MLCPALFLEFCVNMFGTLSYSFHLFLSLSFILISYFSLILFTLWVLEFICCLCKYDFYLDFAVIMLKKPENPGLSL